MADKIANSAESPILQSAPGEIDVRNPRSRILLVDDNADMREYVRRLLAGNGYEVVAVADGEAALAVVFEQAFDLVLADVVAPRPDGFGLLKALRDDERTRTMPVILLSARAGEESRVQGLEAAADDYLVKPFSAPELLARLEAHLKLQRVRREAEEKCRTLFDSIDEGFCLIEVFFDEKGKPFDYRFLEANPAFVEQTGLKNAVGKTVLELAPQYEKFWLEVYGETARTGEPRRFEHRADALNPPRWYDVYAFRIGAPEEHRIAVIFNDIANRKRAERELTRTNRLLQATFDSSLQDIQLFKAVRDERGDIIDFEWLLTNKRWNDQWGEMTGKRLLAENPAVVETGLFDKFKQVTETGVPHAQEQYYAHEQFDGWFWLTAAKVEDGFLLSTLDITERKCLEQRQEFLFKLSDMLRSIADPFAIEETVTQMAVDYFAADRCYYGTIEGGDAIIRRDAVRGDLPSVAGTYPLDSFAPFKRVINEGRPLAVHDTRTTEILDEELRKICLSLQVASFINAPVIKNGKAVGIFCLDQSAPREWTANEVELATEIAERTWAAVERARAEELSRESEERYRAIFNSINEGFSLLEILFDEGGAAYDVIIRDANPAQDRVDGARALIGKRVREFLPNIEQKWIERYAEVARTGAPKHFEDWSEANRRWYEVDAARVGGEGSALIALVYNDVTERKRQEANLAFLAEVSQDLVHLTNIGETIDALGAKIGEYFNVARVVFGEIGEDQETGVVNHEWHAADLPSMKGAFATKEYFSPEFELLHRRGEIAVVRDVAHDGRVGAERYGSPGVGAFLGVPLIRQGKWRFYFSLLDAKPRDWREDEIALVRELAARIWTGLERAHAEESLRESREKLERELEDTKLLQKISGLLTENGNTEVLYEQVLDAAMAIMRADFASIQRLDAERGELRLLAWRNFHPESGEFWQRVSVEAGTACGSALRHSERVIVPDVYAADFLNSTENLRHFLLSGITAVQSTPLTTREGQLLGMISTHWREAHTPGDRELRLLDILARQAADFFERRHAEEALRGAHQESEQKVLERTRDLREANTQLQAEIAERKQAEAARVELLRRLVTVQEEERRRISRELHDTLGQHLTALHVGLKSVEEADRCPAAVTEGIKKMRALALKIDEEAERLSFELRPMALDDLGLHDALRRHVLEWMALSGIAVDLHTKHLDQRRLPAYVESAVYRIVQEALTNVRKHARATRVSLIVERRRDELLTIIEDNGRGFNPEAASHRPAHGHQLGLIGMRERAALAGGRLDIESVRGNGTTLYLRIPILHDNQKGGSYAGE